MFKYKKWELKLKDVKAYDVLRFEFSNYECMTNFMATALTHNSNLQATITELPKTEGIAEDGGNE